MMAERATSTIHAEKMKLNVQHFEFSIPAPNFSHLPTRNASLAAPLSQRSSFYF
jgi:hypothetical protein